jgi:Family of unknown function (DUF6527)
MERTRKDEQGYYEIYCVGCKRKHYLDKRWKFKGTLENPTFFPSLLIITEVKCHSFIEGGNIRYLSDSTHEYSGKTVVLPDLDNLETEIVITAEEAKIEQPVKTEYTLPGGAKGYIPKYRKR